MDLRDPANRVHPRAQIVWLVLALVHAVALAGVLVLTSVVWAWFPMSAPAWIIAGVVLMGYVATTPRLRYSMHRWETTPTAVCTQTGWITRERRIAPLNRVQTIDFEQGPISRLLGLASVTVTTASASGPVHIHFLARDCAEQVVAELTDRTGSTTGDAT